MTKEEQLKQLISIPGVGKSIAVDLWDIDIRSIEDLKGKSPEKLFDKSNNLAGMVQDRMPVVRVPVRSLLCRNGRKKP